MKLTGNNLGWETPRKIKPMFVLPKSRMMSIFVFHKQLYNSHPWWSKKINCWLGIKSKILYEKFFLIRFTFISIFLKVFFVAQIFQGFFIFILPELCLTVSCAYALIEEGLHTEIVHEKFT